MDTLIQDLRYAIRTLSRRPGFTVVAVLTLALGIGANTALFSVVDGVLLEPLPYPESDRVAMIFMTRPESSAGNFSYANFEDTRERVRSLDAFAAWGAGAATLTGGAGDAARIDGARVTADFFRVFGVEPALGRTFVPEELTPGGEPVVVLSHGLWRDRYGGDPGIVGRTVMLDGAAHTVVGVMPPGYAAPYDARIWRPFIPTTDPVRRRAFHNIRAVGRLAADTDTEAADGELDGIMATLAEAHPDVNAGAGARVEPLRDVIVDDVRSALLVLLGAVGFLLLIACANVANLFLARATSRRREIGIRAAMGAGRGRLVRQFLVESTLLAAVAGAAGVLLAAWGVDTLLVLGGEMIPRVEQVAVDGRVLGVALALSLATGALFGLAPALRVSRERIVEVLRSGWGQSADAGSRRLRAGLVVAEMALAVVLVCGAGLLLRSFVQLQGIDPGFRTERLIGFELALPEARYEGSDRVVAFYDELADRLEALPGVSAAGYALTPPVGGGGWSTTMRIEGRPVPESEAPSVAFNVVSPGYFATLGTPVLRGREFDARDDADAPGVVLINRTAAERFWPGEDPVGRRINAGPNPDAPYATIAGVVDDVREGPLEREAGPTLYFPHAQEAFRSVAVIARTGTDPAAVLPSVRDAVAGLDPELPLLGLGTAEEQLSGAVAGPRFNMVILGTLAALALLLACIGIYGVLAYMVGRRTREIGVRIALGADRRDVVGLVVRDGLRLTALGLAIGLAGAVALGRLLSSLLFDVGPTDPATFAVVAGLVTITALAATWVPARRATRVDPIVALREE
ncbi:MAG: ABC transporter permease [Gemmatimonadota bacterium]